MNKYTEIFRNDSPCPYLPGRTFIQNTFFSGNLTPSEWGFFLSSGWRRFGRNFFRPNCEVCFECRPIRILARELKPTKSQRRVFHKNLKTQVFFTEEPPSESVFHLYNEHSYFRFGREPVELEDFNESFRFNGAPALRSEYYIDGKLAGAGFLDYSESAMSSVYFIYSREFQDYSLGIFSVFAECKEAVARGLTHYHLGFLVKSNPSMAYKGNFHPHEIMDWHTGKWHRDSNLT